MTFRRAGPPTDNGYSKYITDRYTVKTIVRTDITDEQIPVWFKGISTFPHVPEVSYSAAAFYTWYYAVTTALDSKEAHEIEHTWNGRSGIQWEGRMSDIILSIWPEASTRNVQIISNIFRNKDKQAGRNVANMHNGRSQPSLWWLGENYEFSKNATINYLDLELSDPMKGREETVDTGDVVEMDVVSAYPVETFQPTAPIPGECVVAMVEEAENQPLHTEPIQPDSTAVPQPTMVEGMPQALIEAMQQAWRDLKGQTLDPQQKDEIKQQMGGLDQALRLVMKEFSFLAEMINKL